METPINVDDVPHEESAWETAILVADHSINVKTWRLKWKHLYIQIMENSEWTLLGHSDYGKCRIHTIR